MDPLPSFNNLSINGTKGHKRDDYISWADYFMGVAFLAAKRSKDPNTQVGACIVSQDNKIVGIGYNGMPIGCEDDDFPWGKNKEDALEDKSMYVCHAEMNAIVNKNSADLKNSTIYTSLFPCNECAKIIIQSGIKTVVYMSDKENAKYEASKRMFRAARVAYHTIYTSLFPCNECAKIIIQSGIKTVVYMSDKENAKYEASKRMFRAAKVAYQRHLPEVNKIVIEFPTDRQIESP